MRRRYLPIALAAMFVTIALGQSEPPIQFSSAIQANSGWAPNSMGAAAGSLGFLKTMDQIGLTEATLSVRGDWETVGFHIDGGYGDFYRLAMAGDTLKGPNDYISQAYFAWKSVGGLPIRVEAGKFFSSVGAEVPQSYSEQDFNTTRSLLFWYGSPLYHLGVRASAPVTSKLTVGAQLVSGCNTITGTHGHQTVVATATWTEKRWSLSQLYMGGNEKAEGSGWRQLSDTVLTLNPASKVHAYVEALGAIEKRTTSGYDRWYGWATAWRYSLSDRWSISPRVEWYNDATGATTGIPQHLQEFTLTGEYRPTKFLMARLEYRRDWSDRASFNDGDGGLPTRQRNAIIAGMTFLLQRGL
jgi:Putative beta-barrel porin-2, OmpL-like. bbp2